MLKHRGDWNIKFNSTSEQYDLVTEIFTICQWRATQSITMFLLIGLVKYICCIWNNKYGLEIYRITAYYANYHGRCNGVDKFVPSTGSAVPMSPSKKH
jgi:hypothetical protein